MELCTTSVFLHRTIHRGSWSSMASHGSSSGTMVETRHPANAGFLSLQEAENRFVVKFQYSGRAHRRPSSSTCREESRVPRAWVYSTQLLQLQGGLADLVGSNALVILRLLGDLGLQCARHRLAVSFAQRGPARLMCHAYGLPIPKSWWGGRSDLQTLPYKSIETTPEVELQP